MAYILGENQLAWRNRHLKLNKTNNALDLNDLKSTNALQWYNNSVQIDQMGPEDHAI